MKKIEPTPTYTTGPVKLYLDEITEIVEIIDETGDGELYISIGGYQLSSIDEFSELPRKEYSAIFIRKMLEEKRFATLTFAMREKARIDSSESIPVFGDAVLKIQTRLSRARIKGWWLKPWLKPLVFVELIFALFCFILWALVSESHALIWLRNGLIGFVLSAIFFGGYLLSPPSETRIILEMKADRPSFWERNKDKLAIEGLKLIISFGLGIAATLIVQYLVKP